MFWILFFKDRLQSDSVVCCVQLELLVTLVFMFGHVLISNRMLIDKWLNRFCQYEAESLMSSCIVLCIFCTAFGGYLISELVLKCVNVTVKMHSLNTVKYVLWFLWNVSVEVECFASRHSRLTISLALILLNLTFFRSLHPYFKMRVWRKKLYNLQQCCTKSWETRLCWGKTILVA